MSRKVGKLKKEKDKEGKQWARLDKARGEKETITIQEKKECCFVVICAIGHRIPPYQVNSVL